jgi:hypothetical protein
MSSTLALRAVRATAVAALALVGSAAAPLGAQSTHFGAGARATFTAAATTPVTNGLSTPGPTFAFGALGSGTVSGNGIAFQDGTLFASGGGLPTPAYTINFSAPLGAFGADFWSLGTINTDFPFPVGVAQFTFYSGSTTVGTIAQNFGTSGDRVFFGVTGLSAFDRVEVRTNVGDEFWTDDVVVGAAALTPPPPTTVPEPATVLLVGGGLLGLAGVARRRSATAAA